MDSKPWNVLRLLDVGTAQWGPFLAEPTINGDAGNFAGTVLEYALVSSQNSISRDRRDKIYGILGLACDVGTGDIAVDYSISLFELYSNTMSFFTKELFESPSSTEAEECHEYLHFSYLIQNALLGPDLVVSGQAEMRSGRVKCDQASLPPFVLPIFAESEVVSVWGKGRNPPEYLRTPIEWFLETRSR